MFEGKAGRDWLRLRVDLDLTGTAQATGYELKATCSRRTACVIGVILPILSMLWDSLSGVISEPFTYNFL